MSYPQSGLRFIDLRRANEGRCRPPYFKHTIKSWTPCKWTTALAGEVGEAANIIKKVHRGDYTLDEMMPGPTAITMTAALEGGHVVTVREAIARELADVICYVDLLAARLDIDLAEAVAAKFNEVSKRVKAPIELSAG